MDWRDRFRAPAILAATRARHRPDRGVLLSDRDGPIEAYAWEVSAQAMRRVTAQGTATLVVGITDDGDQILYLRDESGAEHGHVHAIPFEGGEPVDLTPDLGQYALYSFEVTTHGFVAAGVLDGTPHVIVCDADGARAVSLPAFAVSVREDEGRFIVTEMTPGQGVTPRIRVLDGSSLDTISELEEASAHSVRNGRVAASVVVGDWKRPAIWVPGEAVEILPVLLEGDVSPVDEQGGTLLLHQSFRSVDRLHLFELSSGETTALDVPLGSLGPFSVPSLHDGKATAAWSTATSPATVFEFGPSGSRPLLPDQFTTFPGASWHEFTFDSTGGVEVQGWLMTPAGDGPFPTILSGHGGPTAVQGPSFAPMGQAWVDHGFAFATVNYRGSTGFGEVFREALTEAIGIAEIDDMVAARSWLVASGIADPEAVILSGYSYGGYLTCMTLGAHPGLWAAGVAGAPVVDWIMLHEDSPATRTYAEALFGGGPAIRAEEMKRASPTSNAQRVDAPVFISAPVADARTPIRPVREYVAKLAAAGVDVELHELRGGHAGVGKDQTIEMMERWLGFATRVVDSSAETSGENSRFGMALAPEEP